MAGRTRVQANRWLAGLIIALFFVAVAAAYGLPGRSVRTRGEVLSAVAEARRHRGGYVIDFRVEQEDSVYPMVPAGAALDAMIRRPNPIVETAAD